MLGRPDTHDVLNQSPPYVDVDLYASDRALTDAEAHARTAVERLAQLAAAALTVSSPPAPAEAFARTRLAASSGASFGTSALDTADIAMLLDRALP